MNDSKARKYIEIASVIREKILKGEYPVGERIPSIRKLAESFNVNPQTVNKATSVLTSQGFLIPRRGAGSVVSIPEDKRKDTGRKNIVMLTDKARSRLITDPLEHAGYHCKDIYLSFLTQMGDNNKSASFMVYDRGVGEVSGEFKTNALQYAGFIVQGGLPDCYFRFFQEHEIPFVLINRIPPVWFKGLYGSVMISLKKLNDAVNYLISLGHKKILYLFSSELEINPTLKKRLEIIRTSAAEWGSGIIIEEFDFTPGSAEAEKVFGEYIAGGFTAAIGYNDVSALGIYSAAEKLGLAIPEKFSVIGFDDIFSSQIADPPLTTIRVDRNALVEKALSILFSFINGSAVEPVIDVVETEMVFRRSASVLNKN